MKKILILSRGAFGLRISSPGIRAYHMADVLARQLADARVTLAVPAASLSSFPRNLPFRVVPYNQWTALREMAAHDIVISTGFPPIAVLAFPWRTLVLDSFTPYFAEWLEATRRDAGAGGIRRRALLYAARRFVDSQLTFADYILAANERQRDTCIGWLASIGLISPATYDQDVTLRMLVDVVPYGVRSDDLTQTKKVLKGVHPEIRPEDKVLLWNGGIVEWFDPGTLLRAFAEISRERDDIKLVFPGTHYPGQRILGFGSRLAEAIELAKELGLYDRTVFFGEGWVPYDEMKDYLLDADLGVCTYYENLEAHYAYRTRFLDLLWAELPLVCTRGDVLADMVEKERLGLTVGEGDVAGVANAILQLLDGRDFYNQCRTNIRRLKGSLGWDVVLKPLVEFCESGRPIPLPKRERMLPLLQRVAEYGLARLVVSLIK